MPTIGLVLIRGKRDFATVAMHWKNRLPRQCDSANWRIRSRLGNTLKMGIHDAKVEETIGREPIKLILDEVRQTVINERKMTDIARALGRTVGGNHTRRVRRGEDADDAEMREILSDWYICPVMKDLYNLQ